MTPDELKIVLNLHLGWLRGEVDGQRADLRNSTLRNADLRNADLSNADLSYADLSNATLTNADLSNATLTKADLSNATLTKADLSNADLSNADLSYADLRNADLRDAYLRKADLSYADLSYSDLRNANLSKADLGQTHVIQLGPIGSRKEYMVIKWGEHLDEVMTSYFTGTLAEFAAAMEKQHGDNEHGMAYRAVIAMVRAMQGVPQ